VDSFDINDRISQDKFIAQGFTPQQIADCKFQVTETPLNKMTVVQFKLLTNIVTDFFLNPSEATFYNIYLTDFLYAYAAILKHDRALVAYSSCLSSAVSSINSNFGDYVKENTLSLYANMDKFKYNDFSRNLDRILCFPAVGISDLTAAEFAKQMMSTEKANALAAKPEYMPTLQYLETPEVKSMLNIMERD